MFNKTKTTGRYRLNLKAGVGAALGFGKSENGPGIQSVVISKCVNKIPTATITIYDGSPAKRDFDISADDKYAPGEKVILQCGYGDDSFHTLFEGIIIKQKIKHRTGRYNVLILECKDVAVKMTVGRKNKYFNESNSKITDSKVIKQIVGEYAPDLKVKMDTTSVQHHKLIQHYATDWDFVVSRAEANGMVVIPDDGKITITKPSIKGAPKGEVSFGDNLFDFNIEVDARTQLAEITSRSWDSSLMGTNPKDAVLEAKTKSNQMNGDAKEHRGSFKSKDLADVIGLDKYQLQHSGAVSKDEIQAWSDAKMIKSRLSRFRGDLKIKGTHSVKPGDIINLKEVAKKFNGDAYVSGVTHEIGDGEWYTIIQIGLPFEWYNEDAENIIDTPAAGLVPAIQGLQIGFVKEIFESGNANSNNRVLVVIPTIDPEGPGIWARMSMADAGLASDGSPRGIGFMPEVGDEVIVGFLNNDPRDPIVLGMLHNESAPLPEEIAFSADNYKKGIITKEKLQILFDDETKIITIQTPSEQKIIIDDEEGAISLIKDDSNSVVINDDGVTIKTAGEFIVEADKGISMTTSSGPIEVESGIDFTATASGIATIEGGPQAVLKGGVVQIN